MKKQTMIITIALAFFIASFFTVLAYPVFAQEKGHEGHNHAMKDAGAKKEMGKGEMDHSKMDHSKMDHSGHSGILINESDVKGYKFAYHLIDMRKKMKNMKGMPEMKDTHHLMVYVKDAHGRAIENGKIGYMIKNPDSSEQKKMTMGMGGGYGADINLGAAGKYTIKTKVVDGDNKLMDEFEYEVK
ncbi:hypothetical protein QUF70_07885 [Desulfobacterales bacterium HSG17]|nr:hypothetical protein [Desulfobacterales bacterium HSG17]